MGAKSQRLQEALLGVGIPHIKHFFCNSLFCSSDASDDGEESSSASKFYNMGELLH